MMPEDDTPRERLEQTGASSLRDAELLAILFRTGTQSMGDVKMAETVLSYFGGLRPLARASLEELQQVRGSEK